MSTVSHARRSLTPQKDAVLRAVLRLGVASAYEVAAALHIPVSTADKHLRRLSDRGFVARLPIRTGRRVLYAPPPAAAD